MLQNWYEVLELEEGFQSSYDQIRNKYKELMKRYHPDHQQEVSSTTQCFEKISNIQKAWSILKDEQLRLEYDEKLKGKQKDEVGAISETEELSNLEFSEAKQCFFKLCRCSGTYEVAIDLVEQQKSSFIVNCTGCSLKIKIINDLIQE